MQNKRSLYHDGIGYVALVDHMGSDKTVVNAARVSFGRDSTEALDARDTKLITYLATHEHMSPFEHVVFTFKVKCPMFAAVQHLRHRTQSYNMISRRYTSENIEVYVPQSINNQSVSNRQCSAAVHAESERLRAELQSAVESSVFTYNELVNAGVSREQARSVLPMCLYTEYYTTVNLRNLCQFIQLRDSEHAQFEILRIAQEMRTLATGVAPFSVQALLS
jgi:thymidylate synthase (FAD)